MTPAHIAYALTALAHAGFLVVGLVLIRVDVLEHRLPDVIVLPSGAALALFYAAAGALDGDLARAGRAAAGGVALFLLYLLLRAAAPAGLGGGDVKLAAPVGMFLAWHGWATLAVGAAAAFVLAAVCALALMAAGRASRDTHIAFGPFMLVGAWAGVLLT
ncbi:prepilin peptidase [Microbacterium sp. NPDC096154]|uniref:prepilin peptidase n=1 Tax=Microbacterium sp. NPDC096154 TaxID=3155549 RepID=UPI0033337325